MYKKLTEIHIASMWQSWIDCRSVQLKTPCSLLRQYTELFKILQLVYRNFTRREILCSDGGVLAKKGWLTSKDQQGTIACWFDTVHDSELRNLTHQHSKQTGLENTDSPSWTHWNWWLGQNTWHIECTTHRASNPGVDNLRPACFLQKLSYMVAQVIIRRLLA